MTTSMRVATADEAQLGALLVQVGDGLRHLCPGVLPHPRPLIEDAVDGGLAQPGLLCDLANLVAVRHASRPEVFLMVFWR